jgi:phosphocarrier protein
MAAEQDFVIVNRLGLHVRPASCFVLTACRFAAEIEIERGGRVADGRSIMGILLLDAGEGDVVTIRGNGTDAAHALEALGALVDGGFGEACD